MENAAAPDREQLPSIGVYFGMQFASNPLFSELNKMMEPYQIE